MYPYILQDKSLTVVIGSKQHTICQETHPNYQKVLDAIRDSDWDAIQNLIDMTRVIKDYMSGNGDIEVRDGDVYFQNRILANSLTDRLLTMLEEDFPVEPLCNFLTNLKDNPSKRAVDELYGFLENNSLPITPDGHFLAYKKVRDDYKDIHSGTFDNSVGQVCEMPRNEVNEDRDQTCSDGLHFCSLEYLPHFGCGNGNRVMIVKINPRDVVSIPSDYDNAKGRTCRYEVVDEHLVDGGERDTTEAFTSVVVGDYDDEDLFPDFEDGFDLEGFFDLENGNGPREVYLDADNRARFADDGRYASAEALDEYERYLSDVELGGTEQPATVMLNEVRKVIFADGKFRYTDNGTFASRAAYHAYQDYLDGTGI